MKRLGFLRLEYVPFGSSGDWKIVDESGTVIAVMNDNLFTEPREWGEALVQAYNGTIDRRQQVET